MARRGKSNDKYLRLTGLWPSKKNDGLWSGKFRNQDLERLQSKLDEAKDGDTDLIFFLWENEKESKKDPEFTLQTCVAEDDGGGRRRSSRSRDDGDESEGRGSKRSSRHEKEDEEEEGEEEEEEKPKSRKPAAKPSKKKDEDW